MARAYLFEIGLISLNHGPFLDPPNGPPLCLCCVERFDRKVSPQVQRPAPISFIERLFNTPIDMQGPQIMRGPSLRCLCRLCCGQEPGRQVFYLPDDLLYIKPEITLAYCNSCQAMRVAYRYLLAAAR